MDNKNTFDLSFWAKKESVTALKSNVVNNQIVAATRAALPTEDLFQQVDALVSEVVNRGIDLTQGYVPWRNIGFALAEGMGNQGRGYFHTLSAQNPDYNETECDKQFDACLKAHGCGITINTLFHAAKEAGIDISAIARQFSTSQTSSQIPQFEECGEMESKIKVCRPTFSDKIPMDSWPKLVQIAYRLGGVNEYTDMMLLGHLVITTGVMPNVTGRYHKRTYYANLYAFITAPPASLKGDLSHLLHFVEPVSEAVRLTGLQEMADYEQKLAEYNAQKHKKGAKVGLPPKEPPYRTLFAPGNCTASALYETMDANQNLGIIMFEPEGDVITQACRNKEIGDFSVGSRLAFHHEKISSFRKTNNERFIIPCPKLTQLISGTKNQVGDMIPTAENGNFSRYAFYELDEDDDEWQDVFAEGEEIVEDMYDAAGKEYYEKVYLPLSKRKQSLVFVLSLEQRNEFNDFFRVLQKEQISMLGSEIKATVRRLGLITFRLAMTLSVLRLAESDMDVSTMETLECDDRDFRIAMEMSNVLISHATSVYTNLLNHPQKHYTAPAEGMKLAEKMIMEKLNKRFTRKEYLNAAAECGVCDKSADRYLGLLLNRYKLAIRVQNGIFEMLK